MGKSINLDELLDNADWTKRVWDLPPINSKEFADYLKSTGRTLEDVKHLPVYKHLFSKHYIKLKEIMENKRKIKARLKKLMKSRISFGSNNNKPKPLFDLENELKNL